MLIKFVTQFNLILMRVYIFYCLTVTGERHLQNHTNKGIDTICDIVTPEYIPLARRLPPLKNLLFFLKGIGCVLYVEGVCFLLSQRHKSPQILVVIGFD